MLNDEMDNSDATFGPEKNTRPVFFNEMSNYLKKVPPADLYIENWNLKLGRKIQKQANGMYNNFPYMPEFVKLINQVNDARHKPDLQARSDNKVQQVRRNVEHIQRNRPVDPQAIPAQPQPAAIVASPQRLDDIPEEEAGMIRSDRGAYQSDEEHFGDDSIDMIFSGGGSDWSGTRGGGALVSDAFELVSDEESEETVATMVTNRFQHPDEWRAEEEKLDEDIAFTDLKKIVRQQDIKHFKYDHGLRQFSVKQQNIPRVVRRPRIRSYLGGDHVIGSTAFEEVAYLRQPKSSKDFDNRFLNINPISVFKKRYKETDPISGTHTHVRAKMGKYVHIGARPRAIHIKIMKPRLPPRVFHLLAARIREHANSNDVLNIRLLRYIKRGGQKVLSMLLNTNQLRTITDDGLIKILQKAVKGSNHLLLKSDNSGGPLFDRLESDTLL